VPDHEFDDSASPIQNWNDYWSKIPALSCASPVVSQIAAHFRGSLAGKAILEIGAGSGRDIVALAKLGAKAHALDKSPVARERIAALAQQEGVSIDLYGDDLRRTPFADDSFDVVYSQGVVEHFRDIAPVIWEQRRIVRSDVGRLIIDVPQTYNPYTIVKHARMLLGTWPPGWETQFSPRDLQRIAKTFHLQLLSTYGWGEHGPVSGKLLSILDKNPWTATCIGAIYAKNA